VIARSIPGRSIRRNQRVLRILSPERRKLDGEISRVIARRVIFCYFFNSYIYFRWRLYRFAWLKTFVFVSDFDKLLIDW